MKIKKISVYKLDNPLTHPYYLSGGRLKFERLDCTFVCIETDEGICGWGEGTPWGHTYIPGYGEGIRAAIQVMAPYLIGEDPCALDHINRIMDTQMPGHLYVKSAVDMACWDILGKKSGLPLYKLFGGAEATRVNILSSVSTGTPESMIEEINEWAKLGYKSHSAKIGGTDIQADIDRINEIEASLPEGHDVTFDVNRAWQPSVALQVLNSVNSRSWVEQPCETTLECEYVASKVPQPILMDESVHSFQDYLLAWKNGIGAGVKIKPNRVGGLTKAKQLRDFGLAVGWEMVIEDLGGTVLADTAVVHLASSTPDKNRKSTWLAHAHLTVDPAPGQGARNMGGFTRPPEIPGIGVEPSLEVLGEPVAVYC